MYHSIATRPGDDFSVPPERLAEQLGALRAAGFALIGLTEALERRAGGDRRRVVALTFDDGYLDFLTAGLPVLADAGATATLYPAVAHLGGPATWLGPAAASHPLLRWDQLAEVADAGVEIGSHGLEHRPLDVRGRDEVGHEVTASRDRLAQRLGRPVRSFCYPHGYHDRAVREAVRAAGYDNACEIGHRRHRPDGDRFAVSRFKATPGLDGPAVVDLVRGGGPRLVPAAKRLAGPAWRLTRRVAGRAGRDLT